MDYNRFALKTTLIYHSKQSNPQCDFKHTIFVALSHNILIPNDQWRSHRGGKGGSVPPLTAKKNAKNQEKFRKNREKRGKIRKKSQKSGSFFHFDPPDR